jgi:hypothetical protein
MLGDQGFGDVQQFVLGGVRIGHETAIEPFRGSGDFSDGMGDAATGGFCSGQGRPLALVWPTRVARSRVLSMSVILGCAQSAPGGGRAAVG